MPLFGKRDQAEKFFKEAKRYADPVKEEFNPERAIRLLEEAVMLKPDREKYHQRLQEIREIKSKIITSSTSEHPMPKDVYHFLLSKLDPEGGNYAHFREQREKRIWVEVCAGGDVITVGYPDEDPNALIAKEGISFPTGYVLSESMVGCAMFEGPGCPHQELSDTIDTLFRKLLGGPPNYVVEGWIL